MKLTQEVQDIQLKLMRENQF